MSTAAGRSVRHRHQLRVWRQRFGGAANIVGAKVIVDRSPATIVGVAPPGFFGPVVGQGFDIALPIKVQRLVQPSTPLTDAMSWLTVMLRMKPGQSLDAATAALRAVQPQVRWWPGRWLTRHVIYWLDYVLLLAGAVAKGDHVRNAHPRV